jgi:HAD superfamily hydrolase (TIGR01549 family)
MTATPAPRVVLPPHAFLFDLDGTLIDTVGTRVEAWMDIFGQEGIPADPAFVGTLMGSDGRFVVHTVVGEAGRTVSDAAAIDIDHRAGLRFGELNHAPRALAGVREIVDYVESLGLPWAIATSSLPGQVQESIDALGLDSHPVVTDGSHVDHAKPAPDLLLNAAQQIKVEPAGTWYVGDSRWDMLAAVAAGMTAIGVTTGATPAEELREAGAAIVVEGLPQLLATVGELVA